MAAELLSFIIPVYRNFSGIYPTLDSLFLQDYPAIELIISDDGSPNYAEELPDLKQYIEAHRPQNIREVIYHHLPENRGTVINCNTAYRMAHGVYLKDLAPEDELACPDALSRYVACLKKTGALLCFSRQIGITEDGAEVAHLSSSAEDYDVLSRLTPDKMEKRLFARNCLPGTAWMARRELYERYGYYLEHTRLVEDYPYWLHLSHQGVSFAFLNDVLIRYKLSGSGQGHYSPQFIRDVQSIYAKQIFPYDHRFGPLQGGYNLLKRMGLEAYMDRACWDTYTFRKKLSACLCRWPFHALLRLQEAGNRLKNRKMS
ncbi:MAG: glycosyltransferase family 2 protein [Clostridia bacterium]|nr:glycosyltransferase family 2 protein [Clostridia bacterium]